MRCLDTAPSAIRGCPAGPGGGAGREMAVAGPVEECCLAAHFESEVEHRIEAVLALLEPVMMMLLAGLVGFTAVSIMVPLYGTCRLATSISMPPVSTPIRPPWNWTIR